MTMSPARAAFPPAHRAVAIPAGAPEFLSPATLPSQCVGLIGYFGWGNFGDELMLKLWQDSFDGVARTEPVHSLLQRPYFTEPADTVAGRYGAMVIGGGDLVVPGSISSLYWNRAWLMRSVVIAGVGVALESPTVRPDVVDRLHRFFSHHSVRSISARDSDSAEWIRRELRPTVPVVATADLAFASVLPKATDSTPKRVGIVLRKTPSDVDRRRVERIRAWAARHGFETELLALATGKTLVDELAGIRACLGIGQAVRTCSSVNELCQVVGGYRCLFTAKFHGAVIAARYGVPSLSLRPTHKIRALAGQLGDSWLTHDPIDLSDAQLSLAADGPVNAAAVRRAELSASQAVCQAVTAAISG